MAGPRAGTRGTRTGGGHRVGTSSGASRGSSGGSRPSGARPVGGPRFGGPRPHHGGPHHHHHGGPHHHHHVRPHHHHHVRPHHHHHHHYSGGSRRAPSLAAYLIVAVILVAVVFFSQCDRQWTMGPKREKLNSGNQYISNCVVDQIDWVENKEKVGRELKTFWKKTGVQPYVVFKAYDAEIDTDAEKDQWAMDYYDTNFTEEDIFVYVYFAEENIDEVGYMSFACGRDASKVMDEEAMETFWQYVDEYWMNDKISTDELIINVFNKTAKKIM